jgi:hypothetical protein
MALINGSLRGVMSRRAKNKELYMPRVAWKPMEESEVINPHCICANKGCPMFGNCKDCRAYHKIQKPYCESGRVKRAFMSFTFRIYGAIAGVKPGAQ